MNQPSIKTIISDWKEQIQSIKEQLIVKGDQAHTIEYNLLSCEALTMSLCINDLTEFLLDYEEWQKTSDFSKMAADSMKAFERHNQNKVDQPYPIDPGGEVKF